MDILAHIKKRAVFVSLGITILLLYIFWPQPASKITMLDVGQGLSVLIEDNNGYQILYDAGPGSKILPELAKALPVHDNHINVIALSHTHADHLQGFIEVLERYRIDEVWLVEQNSQSDVYQKFIELINSLSPNKTRIKTGWQRILPSGLHIKALHPNESYPQTIPEHAHDAGLVLQISDQNNEGLMLLTGDLEAKNETQLINNCQRLSSLRCQNNFAILQVSHHGSKNTTTDEFLQSFTFKQAWISAGVDNKFNHPHPDTVVRLNEANIYIKRTDLDGGLIYSYK